MPLETFRSRHTIQAVYFDGSLESALEVARLFPSRLQIEFTGADGSFLLRATNQAAILHSNVWVYENSSGRVEWRDTGELDSKWEKAGGGSIAGRRFIKPKEKGKRK